MKLSLVVMTAGKSKGQAIPINLPQFIIGRDPQCNLRPASAVISKRHCALLIKDNKVFVRDFDSTNGTFINEVPVKGEAPVQNNDVLKLGPLEFKVTIETKPASAKPTPPPPKPAASAADNGDDESVAAMLLSLQEDGSTKLVDETASRDEAEVPGGSTVMDVPVSAAADGAASASAPTPTPEETKIPAAKKPDPKTDPAHLAAKAILEKYSRRTRG